jgi:hypothetical protein
LIDPVCAVTFLDARLGRSPRGIGVLPQTLTLTSAICRNTVMSTARSVPRSFSLWRRKRVLSLV